MTQICNKAKGREEKDRKKNKNLQVNNGQCRVVAGQDITFPLSHLFFNLVLGPTQSPFK
jgi:hypothetical protein